MVLYIDETENKEYFIVGGILATSEQDVRLAYKRFKKSIKNYPLSDNTKQKIFLEFKSTLIDKQFQKIKVKLLKYLTGINVLILYSYYEKKGEVMKERLKESIYITLLSNIVNTIEDYVDITFDAFKNKKFEELIVNSFLNSETINSIVPHDSQESPGLQFADNVCSVIRLHLSGKDKNNYYSYIEKISRNV